MIDSPIIAMAWDIEDIIGDLNSSFQSAAPSQNPPQRSSSEDFLVVQNWSLIGKDVISM